MEESSSESIRSLLSSHDYFRGLGEDILDHVVEHIELRHFEVGDWIHRPGEPIKTVYFLVSGRLKSSLVEGNQSPARSGFLEPGASLGLTAGAMEEAIPLSVIAVEPSRILCLDYERAFELAGEYSEMRRLWERRRAGDLRTQFAIRSNRRSRRTVAVFHQSAAGRKFTASLVRKLRDLGEQVVLFSDEAESQKLHDLRVHPLVRDGKWLGRSELQQSFSPHEDFDRVVLDVDAALADTPHATRLITSSNQVIWFAMANDAAMVRERLSRLLLKVPLLREKICLVWLLDESPVAPVDPELREMVAAEIKIATYDVAPPRGYLVSCGLERLVHWLRGIRIGLALGGGAARGMAHLGVLRALESEGIVVDAIAGTSAGAMVGIAYASGLDPDFMTERFAEDLKPGWFFRRIPSGSYWYLMYNYRAGKFDPMLRRYLGDSRLEQLPISCSAVTVDLVEGKAVVRRDGDAVHAILDSINLPVLSHPIIRSGQALVDGGILNNLPADVLVSQGCNFVIAVDVVAKMESEFARIRPDTTVERVRTPATIPTILRMLTVQNKQVSSTGARSADVRIEPDVSRFSLAAFTRAKEMADIGEQALRQNTATIRELLVARDAKLFEK